MKNLKKNSKKNTVSNKIKKKNSTVKVDKDNIKKDKISIKEKKTKIKRNKLRNKKSKFGIKNNKFRIILSIIIFTIFLAVIQISYSFFTYNKESKDFQVIGGELYLHYLSGDAINLNNIYPTDTYDLNNFFEFSVVGKNESNKDILYEIVLKYGNDMNDKVRLDDKFLKFRLTEVINNEEKEIFVDKSFEDISNTIIHIDSISKNTTNEIERVYRLYVYVNDVIIGNTEHCNYTALEWQNIYANINIKIQSDKRTDTYIINYNPNRLSSEYQEVEYIESFGNEYIKTNIIPNENIGIYMKVLNKEINNSTTFFGVSNISNDFIYSIGNKSNNIMYNLNQSNQLENSLSDNLNIIELNYLNDKKIKLNNNIITSLNNIGTNDNEFTIFALNQDNNIINHSSIKLYNLKISIDDTIKYDFIPCYRIKDNKTGLYDIINNKFYETETGTLKNGEKKKIEQRVNYNSLVSLLDNSFSNKFHFYEWNTKPDGSGTSYKSNKLVKNFTNKGEAIDLYAIWTNKIVIDEVKVLKTNNSNITIKSSNKLNLNSTIELSSDNINNSNVLLSITLKNYSSYDYSYSGINYTFYDNNSIVFDIFGIKKNDIIKSGESLTFRINFKFNNDSIESSVLNSTLNFIFKNLSGMKLSDLIILNNENQEDGADGLYKYGDKYYFSGINVNNYIWFNCNEGYESGESNCEKWRIISIEKDGGVKIIKDTVLSKEVISSLENTTNFWLNNTSQWMRDTKVLAEGRILFDIKGRRPNNQSLINSYCRNTSNGCNAFSADSKNIGLYKNLKVDSDSLAKKYLDEVYFKYALKDNAKEKIKQYIANIGLVESSLSLENIIKNESNIKTELNVGLLNISDYIYANKDTSCWNNFSKCTNNSSNNWLTLPNNPYYLINGKIVSLDNEIDKNAQMWTVQSGGIVSRDANNEFFLRPIVILNNEIKALGTGIDGDYYTIL